MLQFYPEKNSGSYVKAMMDIIILLQHVIHELAHVFVAKKQGMKVVFDVSVNALLDSNIPVQIEKVDLEFVCRN